MSFQEYFNEHGSEVSIFNFDNLTKTEGRCFVENQKDNIFGTIVVALIVIGLVGNSLVFFTIMVLREYKKSVTNWYILQLTLADSLFLLMLPFTAHSEFRGKWEFSESLCKFKEAVIFINYYASIYFLVVMSFDRYLAVTKAFASNYWVTYLRSSTASYVISIVGWIFSALLCIQLYNYSRINDCNICRYEFPENRVNLAELETNLVNYLSELNVTDYKPTEQPAYESHLTDENDLFESYSNLFFGGSGVNELIFNFTNNNTDLPDFNIDYTINSESDFKQFLFQSYGIELDDDALEVIYNGYYNSLAQDDSEHSCKLPNSTELHIWLYGNFAGAFVLPFILVCYFYGMIMKTLTAASTIGENERQRSYRRRVTLIVLALVTLFGVSWLPWYVEKLTKVNGINLTPEQCDKLSDAVRAIAYLNSAFNPYFYSFLGFHFRDRLKRASGQVRLLSSLRSRATLISSVRRKRQSSSNSVGSIRAPTATPVSTNGQTTYGIRQETTARASMTQKTERTVA